MIIIDEYRVKLRDLREQIVELGNALNIEKLRSRLAELEEEGKSPDFWNDMERSQKILQEQKIVKEQVDKYNNLVALAEEDIANEEAKRTRCLNSFFAEVI